RRPPLCGRSPASGAEDAFRKLTTDRSWGRIAGCLEAVAADRTQASCCLAHGSSWKGRETGGGASLPSSATQGQDMFKQHKVEIEWGGRPLILETGKIARQADGAVLATYGETVVLATVVSAKEPKPGIDFFPLTVNYQEKTFAAGKIPGGYFKREGRPSEKET